MAGVLSEKLELFPPMLWVFRLYWNYLYGGGAVDALFIRAFLYKLFIPHFSEFRPIRMAYNF